MSTVRVGLLVNPAAAGGHAARMRQHVDSLLRAQGFSVIDVTASTARHAKEKAIEVIDDLAVLVVVGGDGTVSLGAEIVRSTNTRLGIIAAGSGNDQARSLGLPIHKPRAAMRAMLKAMLKTPRYVDAMQITSAQNPTYNSLALGSVNLGFDALVNARANQHQKRGSKHYSLAAMQELLHFKEIGYTVQINDGPKQDLDASLLTVCNGAYFGGGMKLAPHAQMDDGKLDLISVSGLNRMQLMRHLPKVYQGRHINVEGFNHQRIEKITVGLRDDSLLRVYADGEARCVLPVTVQIKPATISVLSN